MLLTGFLLVPLLSSASALSVDVDSPESIRTAATTVAASLFSNSSSTDDKYGVGLFKGDIYWWAAGAVWSGFIDYWSYTGDSQYNDRVSKVLVAQRGPDNNYMPPNQTKNEGNDDQGTWALGALRAAERGLPQPSDGIPRWEEMAAAVFDLQVARWDDKTCGGGLRWQIFTFNRGYDYKNSATQAMFFLLAARLARFTGNQTYVDWATKSYDWTEKVGLIGEEGQVYDGTTVESDCSQINKLQWSYNNAAFLYGSAIMANLTANQTDSPWLDRTETLITALLKYFFNKSSGSQGILTEIACEPQQTCSEDQTFFKALSAQWLGEFTQLSLPSSLKNATDRLNSSLATSAQAAAKSCTGSSGDQSDLCGSTWTSGEYDDSPGLGSELSALNVFVANLAWNTSAVATQSTNATSTGSAPSGTSAVVSPSASPSSVAVPAFGTATGTLVCLWAFVMVAVSRILFQ